MYSETIKYRGSILQQSKALIDYSTAIKVQWIPVGESQAIDTVPQYDNTVKQ